MIIKALKQNSRGSVTNYVYLDGILEDLNDFDLVYIREKDMPKTDGEYPCEVKLENVTGLIPAMFFYWKVGEKDRGLVVKLDDYENMVHARAKYMARTPFL